MKIGNIYLYMNLHEEIQRQRQLMQLNEFGSEQTIPLQAAHDRQMFGPVYHGTSQENLQQIHQQGFRLDADQSHGYPNQEYAFGFPPPIHHLGYGIYFTTSKAIAIKFNHGTTKGLKEFYLDIPRLETINFGANTTMMKWWLANGYDGELAKKSEDGRIMATKKMTEFLKSKYDAVWFKGKGLYRLLDGDQVVVFDPSRIYYIDNSLAQPMEVGSKVVRVKDGHRPRWDETSPVTVPKGMIGIIISKADIEDEIKKFPNHWARNTGTKYVYGVKWQRGGTESNITDSDIEPK